MSRDESAPFGRGETFYQGGTIDSANLGGLNLEGQIRWFEDLDYSAAGGAKPQRSGRLVKCMIVRNVSAFVLNAKNLVTLQTAGTDGRFFLGRVDGRSTVDAAKCFPVDEFLPSTGCPINDLCWIVVDGPAKVTNALTNVATNVFAVGTVVVSLTAATSGATSAGRAAAQDISGATTPLANQIQNRIGYAMSSVATSGVTNTDILVDVRTW